MSIFFDALKKAERGQVEKLFDPANKERTTRAHRYYPAPQHKPLEDKPDAATEQSAQESAFATPLKSKFTSIAPPPPQFEDWDGAKHPQVNLRTDRGKLIALDSNTPASLQLAALRSKFIALSRNQDTRTICVTSSTSNEGKTFISTNLALALASESERGVVVVDCDMRNPSVHHALGIRDETGLADFLISERTNIDSFITDTGKRLACIPGGRKQKNPLPLLDSEKMKWLIGELRNRYDFVIIDAPPTELLADVDILASLTDGLIFVIKAGQTPLTLVQRSLKMLSNHKITGTVLNGTRESSSYSYYGQNSGKHKHQVKT